MIKYDKKAAQEIELSYNTPDIANQRLRTLQALAINAGEHVLDAGCGTGFLTKELAMLVGTSGYVLGVDNSAEMLKGGRERCEIFPQIELKQAEADALPVEDNSFDVVTCTQVLLYVTNLSAVLAELYRVLKPSGRIAIIETDWRGVVVNSDNDALSRRVFAAFAEAVPNPNLPPQLSPLLREQGFNVLRVEPIPIINTNMTPANFSASALEWLSNIAEKQGFISSEERKHWLSDLSAKADRGEYFFCVNRFLFSGVK